jgi:16S rRNA (cytosine1402-N4)-methyltransferase
MSNIQKPHRPVLLNEVINFFKTEADGYFIDATLGYAGHSEAILKNSPNLKLIGIDQDLTAINYSKQFLKDYKERVEFRHGRFSEVIQEIVKEDKKVIGILADIGVSSLQFDDLSRGFSFQSDNLDMRMNQTSSGITAEYIINNYSEFQLSNIFQEYGEIRNSKQLAKKIVANRPIKSGKELAGLFPKYKSKTDPATKLFQAIRIEVNQELEELKTFLDTVKNFRGARIGIISFHSLEDRIVKNSFKEWAKNCICSPEVFQCTCGNNNALGKILTKKPIIASADEVKNNPRSRSAKLRVFQLNKT